MSLLVLPLVLSHAVCLFCYDTGVKAHQTSKNQPRRHVSVALVALLAVLACAGVAFATYLSANPFPEVNTEEVAKPALSHSGFSAQQFYEQVETGMDIVRLNQVAGRNGECTVTDVYPAPQTMPCYWSDEHHVVTVTLSVDGKVISKSLQDNTADRAN
jgi:hypothetical protein